MGLMAQAANIGGLINHPEIRGAEEATTFAGHMGRVVGDYVRDTPWTWIAAETLHFVGLSLLVGVILLIDLRVLGFMPQVSFAALDRLLPWAMLGFALNVFTGMLFFAAAYRPVHEQPGVLLEADLRAAGRRQHAVLHLRPHVDHGARDATPRCCPRPRRSAPCSSGSA